MTIRRGRFSGRTIADLTVGRKICSRLSALDLVARPLADGRMYVRLASSAKSAAERKRNVHIYGSVSFELPRGINGR